MDSKEIKIVNGQDVEAALEGQTRVYLCGNLSQPQSFSHIVTSAYEMGISSYNEETLEKPHYHAENEEYNYVICGNVQVYIFSSESIYEFSAGDMYVIPKGTKYMTRAFAGSRVLFTKVPGGNDKVLCDDLAPKEWTK